MKVVNRISFWRYLFKHAKGWLFAALFIIILFFGFGMFEYTYNDSNTTWIVGAILIAAWIIVQVSHYIAHRYGRYNG